MEWIIEDTIRTLVVTGFVTANAMGPRHGRYLLYRSVTVSERLMIARFHVSEKQR
jgi:hypothetical protein